MADITVRALTEDEWETYRDVRLAALRESPEAFVATVDEEAAYDEDLWRTRMARSQRLLAQVDKAPVGVVSIGRTDVEEDRTAELFGLWVHPEWRGKSVAATLVRRGAEEAHNAGLERLAYWVGSDNGRAVAFASSFGFRPTDDRRPMRVRDGDGDEEEVAMILALGEDRG
ncbi:MULTISPECIES: GNAT family N-acetyltransferase [unclassified Janibacter]|uniref:GNAT family N-acetyltransferase n=1 Tax=unclassified Janibacter TaxID=2649294 RepID=UPI003D04A5EA